MNKVKKCKVCGSTTKVCNTEIGLLCGKHYLQYRRHGRIQSRTKFDPNEVIECENHCEVVLYDKDNNEKCRALIDLEDKQLVKDKKWCCNKNGYVISGSSKPFTYLHRLIMSAQDCDYVDHINGNTLDNRKQNLRLCTNAKNLQNRVNIPTNNSSGIIGVHFDRSRNKWKVEIGVNGKNKYIGRYNTLEEATKARRDAELLYYNVNYEINQTKF